MEQFMATGFPNKRQKIAHPEDVRLWEGLVSSLKVSAENKDVIFAELEKAIAINREASPHIAREMDRLAREHTDMPDHYRLVQWLTTCGDAPTPVLATWRDCFESLSLESKACFMGMAMINDDKSPELSAFFRDVARRDIPDKLRALALFAFIYKMPSRDTPDELDEALSFLRLFVSSSTGDKIQGYEGCVVGPLAKFAATWGFLRCCEVDDEPVGIASMLALMEDWNVLHTSWTEQIPNVRANWAVFSGSKWQFKQFKEKVGDLPFVFSDLAIDVLAMLSKPILRDHLYPALLKNCERRIFASGSFMTFLVISTPLPSGAFIDELPPEVQQALHLIARDTTPYDDDDKAKVPTSAAKMLGLPPTREELVKFVNTPLPANLANAKRFPNFDGLETDTPWTTLGHAYGTAGDMPSLIRGVASSDPKRRNGVFSNLYAAPYHQGTVYSCTPFVAKWLLKLLEYEMQQDKAKILAWLTHAAVSWPESYTYARFKEADRVPAEDQSGVDPEYHFGPSAVRDTYNAVLSGVDLILDLLKNSTRDDVRANAIFCLQFFPRRQVDILSVAFELLNQPTTSPAIQAGLWLLVSGFITADMPEFPATVERIASVWPREELHPFLRMIAAYSHSRMLQDTVEPLPAELKASVLHFSAHRASMGEGEEDEDAWPWSTVLMPKLLQARKSEFVDDFIAELSRVTNAHAAEKVAMSLLGCCFEFPGGSWSSGGRLPDWYDFRAAFWSTAQRKALDAIAACDLCWETAKNKQQMLEEREKSQSTFVGMTSGSRLQTQLHHLLELQAPATRDQLVLSLKKLDELPAISKDDLASGQVRLTKYNMARFLEDNEPNALNVM